MTSSRHEQLDPDESRVVDDIREYGWHAVCVEEDEEGPGFNYSVGLLETLDHPEIIVFGLDRGLMHDVMWNMVREIRSGRRFEDPVRYEEVLEGCACAIRPVHGTQHAAYLGYAIWYTRWLETRIELRAVQLIWPGKVDGLFPWEPGCAPIVIERQPLLYLPAAPAGDT